MLRHASGPAAGQLNGTALRLGEGVSGWVAANRQVMINSEASLDLGEQAHSGVPLKHALSVPLITRESLVGTITLYAETAFTESQSRLVQVIAPHLAQAVWAAKRNDAAHIARAGRAHRRRAQIPICASSRRDKTFAFRTTFARPHSRRFRLSTFFDLPQISSRIFRFVPWRLPCSAILRLRRCAPHASGVRRDRRERSCGSSCGWV